MGGLMGSMADMQWLARNVERRTDPRLVVPGAQSVIVLAMNYYQGAGPSVTTASPATPGTMTTMT